MLLVDPVTAALVTVLCMGNVDESCKAGHTKDPDIHYQYDEAYFRLGDENHCCAPEMKGCPTQKK